MLDFIKSLIGRKARKGTFSKWEGIRLVTPKIVHYSASVGQQKDSHKQATVLPSDRLHFYYEDELSYHFTVRANREKGDYENARNSSVIYISKDSFINLEFDRIKK